MSQPRKSPIVLVLLCVLGLWLCAAAAPHQALAQPSAAEMAGTNRAPQVANKTLIKMGQGTVSKTFKSYDITGDGILGG